VSAQVAVQVDDRGGRPAWRPRCGTRWSGAGGLHLSYYVPGRDEATERDVDPMRLLVVEGRTYLEGWCLRAEAVRLFRLDRVLALAVLDEGRVGAGPRPGPGTWTRACTGRRPKDAAVELELSAAGRWVAEYYPCEHVEELGDGRLRVGLRTPDTRWVRRLAPAARRRTAG